MGKFEQKRRKRGLCNQEWPKLSKEDPKGTRF